MDSLEDREHFILKKGGRQPRKLLMRSSQLVCQNTKVAIAVAMAVRVLFLYLLFAPAAMFIDDGYLFTVPRDSVRPTVDNRSIIYGPTRRPIHNQFARRNDSHYTSKSHGVLKTLGTCDLSLSAVSSDTTTEDPDLAENQRGLDWSWNANDDISHLVPIGNDNHSYAASHVLLNDIPYPATGSDCTVEEETDSELEEKDSVLNEDILSAVKELTNYTHGMTSELAETIRSVTDVQNWNVLSTIRGLYNYMYSMAREFAENVRSVIHEEFNKLLDSMRDMIVRAFTYPEFIGTLLNEYLPEVADTIMAIGLIIICLFLNCLFGLLNFGILFILAFDWAIFLVYMTWGPACVYYLFWLLVYYLWYLVSLLWMYTSFYFLLAVIVVFCVLSLIILPIRSCRARRAKAQQLQTIEQTVLSLSERLSRMEERQTDRMQYVHVTIEETAARAEENVFLRKINSDVENIAKEIQQLKTTVHSNNESIATLTDEVQELKATVNAVSNGSIATIRGDVEYLKGTVMAVNNEGIVTLTDEVRQLRVTVNEVHSSSEGIASLTNEVQQLKATVNEVSNESIATLTDEVQQLKATVNEACLSSENITSLTDEMQQLKAHITEMHSIIASLEQQLTITTTSLHSLSGSTVNIVRSNETSSSHSCSGEQPFARQNSTGDSPASGARMIWGTYSNTIEKRVEETLVRLTSVSDSDFTVTKVSKAASKKWWFIISAEESVLLKLQEEWHLVKAQTHWKLKKAPTDQASNC